jgi:BirA family biotin operon repressor/biotin-[acetyl-CoA-carboxylase] ligase
VSVMVSLGLLQKYLGKARIPYSFECYQSVRSTNDVAKELLLAGKGHGTVVIADTQTGGRGRRDRPWFSHPGGIYMSIVLKPLDTIPFSHYTFLTGLTCAAVLRREASVPVMLKWPNDLLVDDQKLGGILSELVAGSDEEYYIVLGIGLNINLSLDDFPLDIRHKVTSLRIEGTDELSLERLIGGILRELDSRFLESDAAGIIEETRGLCCTIGRHVHIMESGQEYMGEAVGIAEDGALLVRNTEQGIMHIINGDVGHLRDTSGGS